MSAPQYPQTVRLIPRERTYPDGSPVKHGDFDERPPIDLPGWMVQPLGSSEETLNELASEARWRIWGPAGDHPVRPQDVIEHGGMRLHVDGELQTWPDLQGEPHHVEGLLKRWRG